MTVPACMTDAEFAAWTEKNEAIPKPEWRASTPCMDCPHWFAQEQRELGSCDGAPGKKQPQATPYYLTAEYKREKLRRWRRGKGVIDIEQRTSERVEMALRLRESGLRNVDIARHMGVQRQTVGKLLKKAAS